MSGLPAGKLDFGYSPLWIYGHLIIAAVFGLATGGMLVTPLPAWVAAIPGAVTAWALVGWVLMYFVFESHKQMTLRDDGFITEGHVLDMGCGSGRTSVMIGKARPGVRITGLDNFSARYISGHGESRLMHNLRVTGIADRFTFVQGDMLATGFDDGQFDAVVSTYALDHMRDKIPHALAEAARVLKPGGQLLLAVIQPNVLTVIAFLGMTLRGFDGTCAWREKLGQAGFRIDGIRHDPTGAWFLAHKS